MLKYFNLKMFYLLYENLTVIIYLCLSVRFIWYTSLDDGYQKKSNKKQPSEIWKKIETMTIKIL